MKTTILALLVVLACVVSGGCSVAPTVLYPKAPAMAPIAGMTVTDQRKPIKPAPNLKPKPDPSTMLDFMTVLPNNTRVADFVASVVATEFPGATVALKEFDIGSGYLVYFNIANSQIVADITPPSGKTFTISAEGTNPNWKSGERNLELAIDRALEDFARKLKSVRTLATVTP
jgi:hypothetical protein